MNTSTSLFSSKELVSAVIPTYNRRDSLPHAIESVLRQTHRVCEIIVVDDGSSDDTQAVLQEYSRSGKIIYKRQANMGPAAARNKGVKLARGSLVAFLDSDDIWYPWKIKAQVDLLRKLPVVDLVFSDLGETDHNQVVCASHMNKYYPVFKREVVDYDSIFPFSSTLMDLIEPPPEIPPDITVYWGNIFQWLFRGNFISTSTVLVRKSMFMDIGGMNERLQTGEDSDFYLRFSNKKQMAFINCPSGLYSLSSKNRLTSEVDDGIAIRKNWYDSIQKVLREDYEFAAKNRSMVDSTLSDRALRIGQAYFRKGDPKQARIHLRKAMLHKPSNVVALVAFCVNLFPPRLVKGIYGHILKKFKLFQDY